jgi:hypothetical protein
MHPRQQAASECECDVRTELGDLPEPAPGPAETEAELVERVGQPTFRRRPIRATRKTSSFRWAAQPWHIPACLVLLLTLRSLHFQA